MELASLFDVGAFAQAFSSNVYISGIVMILLNCGTSYLMQDITPITHRLFSSFWVRRLVFFAIFFTATRDLKVSLVLMVIFTLLVDMFLNEKSQFCLIPYQYRQQQSPEPSLPSPSGDVLVQTASGHGAASSDRRSPPGGAHPTDTPIHPETMHPAFYTQETDQPNARNTRHQPYIPEDVTTTTTNTRMPSQNAPPSEHFRVLQNHPHPTHTTRYERFVHNAGKWVGSRKDMSVW